MQLVQFGAEGVPLSTAWLPGMANEVCWVEPEVEKAIETMEAEEAAEPEGEVENSVWLRARRKRWADETDTSEEESEEKVDASFNNIQLQSPGASPQRSSASDAAPSRRLSEDVAASAASAASPVAAPVAAVAERTESPPLRRWRSARRVHRCAWSSWWRLICWMLGVPVEMRATRRMCSRVRKKTVDRSLQYHVAAPWSWPEAMRVVLPNVPSCADKGSVSKVCPAATCIQLVPSWCAPKPVPSTASTVTAARCGTSVPSAMALRSSGGPHLPRQGRGRPQRVFGGAGGAGALRGAFRGERRGGECGAAVNVVRRSLRSATGEVVALLAEARALGLVEEVCGAERRLLNALAATPSAGPGPPPRSRAMSRASSYDSFFDGDAAKFVLASTPGDTQPSTPRSSLTPTGWPNDRYARYALPDWLAEEQTINIHNQLNLDGFPGSDGQFGVEEKQRDDLQMPATWHDAPLGAVVPAMPSMPSTLVLHRAVPRKRNGRSEEVAWADEAQELRPVGPVASTASAISRHKWQQNAIPPGIGLMWHSSPFGISRTPNIHTPSSHRSPARSPTSFSGYCSPIPGFSSGVASPNQRRSGYSSPSTMSGTAFFAGAATQSGLMRRLMSLREARGEEQEEDSDDRSSEERSEDEGEPPDLLELLLKHAEKVAPSCREPRLLSLDLRPTVPVSQRGLLPCHSVPFLNALVQTLLASSLMPLLAQVSPRQQRPAYSCFMQLALELSGTAGAPAPALAPRWADAGLLLEPLLRRFERGKAVQEAPAFPGPWKVPGMADMFSCFLHFLLGQLHDECKWPSTLSISSSQHEDSPLMRIFGGLIRLNSRTSKAPRRVDRGPETISAFLLLHLDLTESGGSSSVELELQQLLLRYDARFLRLPPFLLLHLERFRTGADGLPDRVSKKCRMDLKLELEEASSYTLRSVPYQLRGAMCHYGEVPEGGAYKALITEAIAGGGGSLRWHVLDDVTVRCKGQEEMQEMLEAEGHHVCFLMYHRLDTKTVNLRPHAALS